MTIPEITAHRGASYDAPENTLAAFNLAWQQGADAIEGDFWITRDAKIVCIHDSTTTRTAGANLTVSKSTLTQLRKLDVGRWKGEKWAEQRIPRIEEVLATIPHDKKIFVEIKSGPAIIPLLRATIADSGLKPEQVVIISFNKNVIAETKKRLPGVKALWLVRYDQDRSTRVWRPSLEQVLDTLKTCNADGLDSFAHHTVNQHFVQSLRKANMEIHIWSGGDTSTAMRFLSLGVDSLTTDRPGWLRSELTKIHHQT